MKKIYKEDVAESLGMAPIQFAHYLQGVKREFKIAPPTNLILKYLVSPKITEPPVPSTLAKLISEQRGYPLKIDKTTIEPPLKVPKSTLNRARKKFEKNVLYRNLPPVPTSAQDVTPYSKFDQERLSEKKLEHCPHGVPKTRVCAICDPEKFKEING